jgi:sugar lactone lactonase YvrE
MDTYRIVPRGGQRDVLGEGLLWSARDNAIYWTDILAPALNRLSLTDGSVKRWEMPDYLGWVIERRDRPGFIAGFRTGFAELEFDPLRVRPIAAPEPGLSDNRLNDAKADRRGRIWAGTMSMAEQEPLGNLYRLDPDGALHTIDRDYIVCNGPAFSPDECFLYHTDSRKGLVYRFAMDDRGDIGPREDFIRFAPDWGVPDGMTTDREGHLWIGHWGGGRVSRFTPDGRLERSIVLPASQITNVCFAGAELDRMFVTSAAHNRADEPQAGSLFEILDPGVTGLPPGQFAG